MSIEELEARLARLEAEQRILMNLYQYGQSIDYGLEERWLDCFTEAGVFDLRYPPGKVRAGQGNGTPTEYGIIYRGRAELAAFVAAHTRAPDRWHKHFLVEPAITVTGDGHATCSSYFARLDERDGAPCVSSFGRYLDRLVECPDGRWRFEERVAEIEAVKR
jgi:hypothetical protein